MNRLVPVAVVAVVAMGVAAPALAAYRPQLLVTPQGPLSARGTEVAFSQGRDHDATARLEIAVPAAYRVALGQRNGTVLGPAAAEVTVRGFDVGAIPVAGRIVVADAVEHAPAAAACGAPSPVAVWRVELAAQTGQAITVNLFVAVSGAAVRIVACFPSPNVPEEAGGAPFGVKLLSARLTFGGVFGAPAESGRHAWGGRFTPYVVGTAAAGTAVEAHAVVPTPARVMLAARRSGARAVLSGRVLETRSGALDVAAQLWEARDARGTGARRVARARTAAKGAFLFRRSAAATRWYRVVVPARETTRRDCGASTAPGGCGATTAPIASRWVRAVAKRR